MSFNPYQNYGAGIAALGPIQAMSDRNEAQTLMANGGQMFASGGIARLAEGGGANLLPKYKYDPVTQRYTLQEDDKKSGAVEDLLGKQKQSDGSSTAQEPSAWDKMSNAEKAAYYAANPTMAAITQMGQKAFGMTGLGQLAAYTNPQAYGEAQAVAKGFDPSQTSFGRGAGSLFGLFGSGLEATPKEGVDVYGYGASGYGFQDPMNDGGGSRGPLSGGAWGGGESSQPSGGSDTSVSDSVGSVGNAESMSCGGGYFAHGGLASLARGGMSHLGDYSDGGRLLRGPGDGVSDSIPATIGDKRPARLADGEFVVPARIVSELGNGSTEAGARKLYAMMDRIQQGRKKSIGKGRVAVNSRADKNLPA